MTHTALFHPNTLRRLARWLLLLWLMAMGCAGSAPLLQAVQPQLDCVSHQSAASKALPADGGGLWHCSQCLMAGPPSAWAASVSLVQRAARAAAEKPASSPRFPSLSLRPPARAPPIS